MVFLRLWSKMPARFQIILSRAVYKREMPLQIGVPYLSFTFDDFPYSALHTGGDILSRYGLRATFYASLGLMNTETSSGRAFKCEDVREILERGHELGCHTFGHYNSWETDPGVFEESIVKNREVLGSIVQGASFRSFSYPMVGPRPAVKRIVGQYFSSARGGGQTFNRDRIDLNLLKAYFLEKDAGEPSAVKRMIDLNCRSRGWLILATHDVSETPTPYGCKPSYFEEIVKYATGSGARILPVGDALESICSMK